MMASHIFQPLAGRYRLQTRSLQVATEVAFPPRGSEGVAMDQMPMFFEKIEDALGFVISALGGAKVVGAKLRPDLPADAAGRWLLDCLNTDRPAFLHPGHIAVLLRMAREANVHNAMDWLCQDTGYAKPTPVEPQDEQAQLMRTFVQSVEIQRHTLARLEALTGQTLESGLRVVKA